VVATAELFDAVVITGNPAELARLSHHTDGVWLLPA
jgi:hypothetical protein